MPWRNPKKVSTATLVGGAWFALGMLGLLALGLALIGVLSFWSEWLEANWHLTFPTPLPPAYWYGFAAVPLLVLLLYFLKLKRRALQVPSTFLWRKSIEDLHVNSLFQWLRKNILLVLQLLFLLVVGYALADPTYNSEAKGRHIIVMIDNSASMSATDEKPSRLEKAKADAHQRIDALDPSDQAMIVAFNSEAQIFQSYTNRKEDLHAAVNRIGPTQRSTAFEQALALAEGQANPSRSAEASVLERPDPGSGVMTRAEGGPPEGINTDVYVYSDGRFPDVDDFHLGKLHPRLMSIGKSGNNVGIAGLALRRDEDRPDQFEASARVLNFSDRPVRVAVQLEVFTAAGRQDRQQKVIQLGPSVRNAQETPDGRKKELTVPGGLSDITTFTIRDYGHGYLRVSLKDAVNGQPWNDDFALDDVAWLALAPVRRARVLRIGPPNDLLDAFFKAAVDQQRAAVVQLPAENFAAAEQYKTAVQFETFDLVIFDRCAPAAMDQMPQANTYFIGQAPPLRPNLWDGAEEMKDLYVKEFRHTHALFRGVETLQGMSIAAAKKLPRDALPARATALVETQQDPALWVLGRDRFTDLVQTFPLVVGVGAWNTNWPKQPPGTLPLFLDNVLVTLGRYKEYEEPQKPGAVKTLDPGSASTVTVVRREPESGTPETLKREAGRELTYGAAEQVGVYEADWGQTDPYRFAVNLFDLNESDIQPRENIWVGDEEIKMAAEPVRQRQELWFWFALAALAVLLLEWYVYQRRIYV